MFLHLPQVTETTLFSAEHFCTQFLQNNQHFFYYFFSFPFLLRTKQAFINDIVVIGEHVDSAMCPNVASRAQGDFKSSTEDNSWRMEHRAQWKQLILPKGHYREHELS